MVLQPLLHLGGDKFGAIVTADIARVATRSVDRRPLRTLSFNPKWSPFAFACVSPTVGARAQRSALVDNRNNPEQESLLSRDPHMHSPACAVTVDQCLPGNWYGPWR